MPNNNILTSCQHHSVKFIFAVYKIMSHGVEDSLQGHLDWTIVQTAEHAAANNTLSIRKHVNFVFNTGVAGICSLLINDIISEIYLPWIICSLIQIYQTVKLIWRITN